MPEMSARRLLVSVLGTNPKDALYELDGRTYEARLAPAALLTLSDEPFDEVVALCTEEAARDSLPLLERAAGDVRVTSVEVAAGVGEGDIGAFLAAFTKSVPEGSVVVVDMSPTAFATSAS